MLPKPVLAIFASAILLLLAAVLSYPGAFGISKSAPLTGIEAGAGFLLTAELPQEIARPRGRSFLFPDEPIVLEDGRALARPRSSSKEIANAGRGRYLIKGSKVSFSTSDAASAAGRAYTVRAPRWSLRESLLLLIWLVATVSTAITFRLAPPRWADGLRGSPALAYSVPGLAAGLIAGMLAFPVALSDEFFLGLLIPAIWAALMGALAMQKRFAARAGLVILALLPALAGYFYYGLNAASHSSFLVAGIIPRSDAWLHFVQAAEISLRGTTQVLFNGRFLYPAFYSVILDVAGLNVFIANLLVSSLVMLGLAATVPMVARRIGFAGTAVYCLLFWLYFRAHGCGLLMTENLGLLLGVLGFGFLLVSVDTNKIWPVFVSLVFFGLGSAARPGALFILPALAVYAGVRVWIASPGRRGILAAAGAFVLGLIVVAGCFAANHLVMKSLSSGEGKAFGNFAFTLHGLLNDTKWSTSAEEFQWDSSLVMQHNIRQMKESPACLVRGVMRAYGDLVRKGFLFRFGNERRFAYIGTAMFFLGLLGCRLWIPLRPDACWIILMGLAILASIPFAPPWDAGERPYATTQPAQIFLASAGLAMLVALMSQLAGRTARTENSESSGTPGATHELVALAALCFALALPIPLAVRANGYRHSLPPLSHGFLRGSQIFVVSDGTSLEGGIPRETYLDRLSDLQALHPEDAWRYAEQTPDFLLAIDWKTLEVTFVRLPDSQWIQH